MPVTVQGPDGNSYQFPDGTDKNSAVAYFKKKGIGAKFTPSLSMGAVPDERNFIQKAVDKVSDVLPGDLRGRSSAENAPAIFGANVAGTLAGPFVHPKEMAKSIVPDKGAAGVAESLLGPAGPFLTHQAQNVYRTLKDKPLDEAIPALAGQAAGAELTGEAVRPVVKGVGRTLSKYNPVTTELSGTKVPSLVGEAKPTSAPGRLQTILKRSGTRSAKFEKFEEGQQDAVKDVIRKTAQETSGLIGPMPERPGAALKSAADATFERARPMYAALDEDLITVPGDFHSASTIVKKAITRAKNLGYDFEASAEKFYDQEPMGHGKPVSDSSHPLTDFQKIRSELGKMRRGSSDPAVRYRISEEMAQMTEAMDRALDNTGLKDTWKEADRLWSKGYALNTIADVLKDSTEGVEKGIQPKGMDPIASKVKGKSLEETLKDLTDDRTLQRGLSPEEISNLRQSANILKRAQETPIGKGGHGENVSLWKGIGQASMGVAGPAAGAGVGMLLGGISGAERGAAIGLIVQQIGTKALVNAMTKVDGVKALNALEHAQTPAAAQAAMTALAAAGSQQSKKGVAPALLGALGAQPPQAKRVAAALTPQGQDKSTPLLTEKNPEDEPHDASFARNKAWSKPGPYLTILAPRDEMAFQVWAKAHPELVEGELNNPQADYDVRGRWLAEKNGDPEAKLTRSKFDGTLHASDKWKTPYDAVFSKESMYALPNAPHWDGDKLVSADGQVIVDESSQ